VNASVAEKPFLARARTSFWPLQIAGWATYFVMNFTAVIGEGTEYRYVFVSLTVALSGVVVTSLLRLGYQRLWSLPLPRMAGSAAALLIAATLLMAFLYFRAKVAFKFCDDCMTTSNPLSYMWYFLSMFYLLLSWSGLYFGIKFAQQAQAHKEATLTAQTMAHEAQLKMLRYQLNPHFLFNTLNAISTLVLDHREDTANRMLGSLSQFLRYSLDSDPVQRVTLAQEIEALQLYLSIEQIRFGERLQVSIVVDDAVRAALVPSLILQPIVENAIKHAVAKREEGGRIEIEAHLVESGGQRWLDVHMRDDGPGCPDFDARTNHTGVGLANTRERLRVLYGARQTFEITNRQPHGADVHIRLPFEPAKDGA
jgi:two-component sensor histidine kinase